ncbi:SH2 domain-containing protein 6-like [Liasis olivaceus]
MLFLCVSEIQGEAVHTTTAEEEEEEEEAQYTYEAPPREEPIRKMSVAKQQEAAEGIYLDCPGLRRFSEPNSSLHSKPCMLLTKPGAEDALKKGMMKPAQPRSLPLAARRVSLPVLASSGHQAKMAINSDPFLAPKDEKDEPKDEPIYVECEATTAVVPCKGLTSQVLEPLTCLLKQAKSKISPLGQQSFPENNPEGRCLKTDILPEDPDMKNAAWYAGSCDRRTAEAALLQFNKNSAFMVRQSSHHSPSQPFTLVVLYKNHVYNVPIQYRESSGQFALGKDGKSHEELFDSVSSIVQKYSERPLVLVDGSTSAKEQTRLLFPVSP